MANVKGTRRENVVRPPIGDKPMGKPISVRYEQTVDDYLRGMNGIQDWLRCAAIEKIERDALL